jgi:hypothetical protein
MKRSVFERAVGRLKERRDEPAPRLAAPRQSSGERPIFIIGVQRSGTSLLRRIFDSHSRIACPAESKFIAPLVAALDDTKALAGWRSLGFERAQVTEAMAAFVRSFFDGYAAAQGKPRWADKTPRYALSVGGIAELFPTCQVVHVIRDGRDVVASHRHRWGYVAALKAVPKWRLYVQAAQTAGAVLGAGRYYEIRYEDLVTDTEATVRKLLDFLGEPWDDAMLDFDRKPHDVQPRYAAFTSSRRAAGDDQRAIYRWRVGAHRRELDPLLRGLFRLVCGRTLRRLGYS